MRVKFNPTGKKFGRLKVLSEIAPIGYGRRVICLCKCGEKRICFLGNLRKGTTKSCGCLHREITGKINLSHGLSDTPEYMSWTDMNTRCRNKNSTSFHRYGGREIKICRRWEKFENFLEDMGKRPDGMEIDRKNNDGDYEPSNCRWATPLQQANNRSSNRLLTFNGKSQTLPQWAREIGKSFHTLRKRLLRGWSVERILSTP